ncbi:MAG: DEAD/DEAH box helicase [Verrucomicrobiales bacterium]
MKPEAKSERLLGWTRAKAKMYEYNVPEEEHARMYRNPRDLFSLSFGMLGDLSAGINRGTIETDNTDELREDLLFSARFFDAYIDSELDETLDDYFLLLCSAAYYLARLPGSSMVLAREIGADCPDISGDGLEDLLLWLLHLDLSTYFDGFPGQFGTTVDQISSLLLGFYATGDGEEQILETARSLRKDVYENGTPRQLLLGDLIGAVTRVRLENSCWKTLPEYSGIAKEAWAQTLTKESALRELWPAQSLLGENGVLRGSSAVIQMPTSAGKTRGTELILRSSFLAGRTTLAVIIAPFRALCHEIRDDLTEAFRGEGIKVDELPDTLQVDFDIAALLGSKQILVVTPEKFLYVLRQNPELAGNVGLVVFDEGHQFDSGNRGIVYELLLTSLRSMLPESTQKVLISAVIKNAEAVSKWLNDDSNVVSGSNLSPTLKSIGFASWLDTIGQIRYVQSSNTAEEDFFVPRVIESLPLKKKGRERVDRVFPDRSADGAGKEVAMYLGLKLVNEGAVAVFCGRKDTAANLCEMAVDKFSRKLEMPTPLEYSDPTEVERISSLIEANFGSESSAAASAALGIFPHHGNTPQGIRLAVEDAMRAGRIRFVVCTSTLAQGVNLPIRYLIVTSIYQGEEKIKVRDFHNLIGRVGRAGMHTEGSVLFSDPSVFDQKQHHRLKWRWDKVQELLNPENSEDCVSSLLALMPFIVRNERSASADGKNHTLEYDILDFAYAFVKGPAALDALSAQIVEENERQGFTLKIVQKQVRFLSNTLGAVESFLLANWDLGETELTVEDSIVLAEETLAFFLSDDRQKESLRQLFSLLAENLIDSVRDSGVRKAFGRTLFGINEAQAIGTWVFENRSNLKGAADADELFSVLWSVLLPHMKNDILRKFDPPEVVLAVAEKWISGGTFAEILNLVERLEGKMIWGEQRRHFKIEQMVETCENGLSFDGSLIIGAVVEFLELLDGEGTEYLREDLQEIQKRLKYGLPSRATIVLYELGFADRVVATSIADAFAFQDDPKDAVLSLLRRKPKFSKSCVEEFPTYFQDRMTGLLES